MKRPLLKVLVYGLVITPFAIGFYVANYTHKGCQFRNGIWSQTGGYCISKDCREKEICGTRNNPRKYCDKLKIGDNLDSVYFWLGEPKKVLANHYSWQALPDKNTQYYEVMAVIEKQKIKQLRCKP